MDEIAQYKKPAGVHKPHNLPLLRIKKRLLINYTGKLNGYKFDTELKMILLFGDRGMLVIYG